MASSRPTTSGQKHPIDIDHDSDDLEVLYDWIDTIKLSRPKKSIGRDFSDGLLVAEVISWFDPKLVDLHNYPGASAVAQKKVNWDTLNRKVLTKLKLKVTSGIIQEIVDVKPGAVEEVLWNIRKKMIELFPNGGGKHLQQSLTARSLPRASTPAARPRSRGRNSQHAILSPPKQQQSANKTSLVQLESVKGKSKACAAGTPSSALDNASSANTEELSPEKKAGTKGIVTSPPKTYSAISADPEVGTTKVTLENILADEVDTNVSGDDGGLMQLIYRGHKMVPYEVYQNLLNTEKDLKRILNGYAKKAERLDLKIKTRDRQIEQLAHQYQQLKERASKASEGSSKITPTKSS